jgi:Cu(I)/Ag(I) efflux system membrane protein CusA/SilA
MSTDDDVSGAEEPTEPSETEVSSLYESLVGFPIHNKLLVFTIFAVLLGGGLYVAPFQFESPVERDPVPVDAIPNIGENQQIVFTTFPGGSPQDVEDQVTYPLSTALQGIPKVKEIRSRSMTGFSMIYVVFEEDAGFYWSRSRIAEKLASLPPGTLPDGVKPSLGPDATPLGQVFWYTLEGRNEAGEPTGGWDLQERRTIQDYYVRYALAAADGVAEVASIGGYKKEYQVEVDPDLMRAKDVTLGQIEKAVGESSEEVGAGTVEISGVEYLIRGIGFVEEKADIAQTVVARRGGTPIRVKDVARVTTGPAPRRGVLTRGGAEAVGGVVVAREGANPRQVIENVKKEIDTIEEGLPSRTLEDGTTSQLEIVPFYDRTDLIDRTVGTLSTTLYQQILVVVLVVLLMMLHLRSSVLISILLPFAVLAAFVVMKYTGVEANVVALAGIAIAIGTMVDLGIIMTENIVQHLNRRDDETDPLEAIQTGAAEVAPAILTAISVTLISILPIFLLKGQEGRMFGPLAHTMTYALAGSLLVTLAAIPPLAYALMGIRIEENGWRRAIEASLIPLGIAAGLFLVWWVGLLVAFYGAARLVDAWLASRDYEPVAHWIDTSLRRLWPSAADYLLDWWSRRGVEGLVHLMTGVIVIVAVAGLLTQSWMPIGPEAGWIWNFAFVGLVVGGVLGVFWLFRLGYETILRTILAHKGLFALVPMGLVATGLSIWLGFGTAFGFLPDAVTNSSVGQSLEETFPGLEREFMPDLDEGSFLYMPVTMPHGSLGEAKELVKQTDMAFESIPEVEESIGKIGRADTPLDPAPIGMLETVVHYKPEYKEDERGRRLRFEVDDEGNFVRDDDGNLIEDPDGLPYRNWRDHIERPADIWQEMMDATEGIPGLTSASQLQPIETRLLMLQSGIRAPVAVRLRGTDLDAMGKTAVEIEQILRNHEMVNPATVNAQRPVGKPYLEIVPDRRELSRWGVTMDEFQSVVQTAIGGRVVGRTIEGRERYNLRVRYPREMRDDPEAIREVLVPTSDGEHVPLGRVAEVRFERGPQGIRSEDGYMVTYVMFASADDYGQIETVDAVRETLEAKIDSGDLELPKGTSFEFAGQYEQAVAAEKRLRLLIPLVVLAMFLFVYLRFGRFSTSIYVFMGVSVAFSGGFLLLWAAGEPWFLDVSLFGENLRDIFQMRAYKLSIAVWVGFLALLGIAAQDGIVMATYLEQRFEAAPTESIPEIRDRVVEAGKRRVRPCLMTTATTILALLPVLTSYGTGSGVMIPMAIPIVGGMAIALITLFVVPTAYCFTAEFGHRFDDTDSILPG